MSAIGLFVLRTLIARPVTRRVRGVSLNALSAAFGVALAVALVATPIYVLIATAQFSLRSAFDLGAIVPVVRASSFGKDFLDLELVLGLFGVAAVISLLIDRPDQARRLGGTSCSRSAPRLPRRQRRSCCPDWRATPGKSRREESPCHSTHCTSPRGRSGSAG